MYVHTRTHAQRDRVGEWGTRAVKKMVIVNCEKDSNCKMKSKVPNCLFIFPGSHYHLCFLNPIQLRTAIADWVLKTTCLDLSLSSLLCSFFPRESSSSSLQLAMPWLPQEAGRSTRITHPCRMGE